MAQVEMAEHVLGLGTPKPAAKPKIKPMKEFHVRELHDGTYHIEKGHGRDHMGMDVKPHEEASASDLDGVHDHLEEHMGEPNFGEEQGESPKTEAKEGE